MNVLLVVPWDNIGGVANVVNRIAQHLRSQGDGVYLLLPGRSTTPVEFTTRLGFRAFRLNTRPTSVVGHGLRSRIAWALTLPITLLQLALLVRRLRVDVVSIHYPASEQLVFAMLRKLGVARLVTSIHGSDMLGADARRPSERRAITELLATSDVVTAPSDGYRRAVARAWPDLDATIQTVPNGVDPTELGYTGADETVDPPYVLSVAHFAPYKGVDVLIRAFATIVDRHPHIELRLVSDGPERATLEALAASLGVADRVRFLGVLDRADVGAQLRGCTLFVLPSRAESFGMAAAEAMAMDRPVIVSRVGGLPDLVEDGVTGLLFEPGDDASLATAMDRLLADAALRHRLGQAAGARIREHLLWDHSCTRYRELFAGLAAPARSSAPSFPQMPSRSTSSPVAALPSQERWR